MKRKSPEQLRSHRWFGATDLRFCCNRPYSGTEVIEDFGRRHLDTGEVILYTSADSVLQLAAHVDVLSEPRLYDACETARGVMSGEHAVGRGTPLVDHESRRPRGFCRVRDERIALLVSEPGECTGNGFRHGILLHKCGGRKSGCNVRARL